MATYGQMDAVCRACAKTSRHVGAPGFKLKKTPCPHCGALELGNARPVVTHLERRSAAIAAKARPSAGPSAPNWSVACMNDGETPTVGSTGLCGPCCFGEAETAGGNW